MGGFGLTEIAIVAAIVLLLFGARHLPAIGSELGRTARKIKRDFLPKKVEDIELPDDFPAQNEARERPDREE